MTMLSFFYGLGPDDELYAARHIRIRARERAVFFSEGLYGFQTFDEVARVAVDQFGQFLNAFVVELLHAVLKFLRAFKQSLYAVRQFSASVAQLLRAVLKLHGSVRKLDRAVFRIVDAACQRSGSGVEFRGPGSDLIRAVFKVGRPGGQLIDAVRRSGSSVARRS